MEDEIINLFKPEAKVIKALFRNSDSYYYVPDYQRPYCWDDEQVETLWDNLYSAMDEGKKSYFLGPMILVKTPQGYEVVDGQQRLTTITILLAVLRDFYFQDNSEIKDSIKSLIDNKFRVRLITQLNYQDQFIDEVLNKVKIPKKITKKERDKNKFLNTALIFKEELEKISQEDRVKFLDFIFNKTLIITIVCIDQSFAIKMFQTLNTTGLDLSHSDLIKSYLYNNCSDEIKKKQFISTWTQIEELSKQIDESLTDLFTYYQYYLLGANPEKTLYEALEDKFEGKDPNEELYKFKKFVDFFMEINSMEDRTIYSLYYIPNQVYWKSILTAAKMEEFSDFEELCTELRKVFYFYWIAGYTSTKYKQLSFNLIKWIKEGKDISYLRTEIDKKINDPEIKIKELMDANLKGGAYGKPWIKPLLILLEYQQDDGSIISFIEMDNKLHIDHILPEKWYLKEEWKLLWNKQDADENLNNLGNLTLLSGKKNIAQQNDPPLRKKEMYEKGHGGITAFKISQLVIKELEKNRWTKKEVLERQEFLINEINKLFSKNGRN